MLFCPHCGAPQVRISEGLLLEAEEARRLFEQERPSPSRTGTSPTQTRDAMRVAALAGAAAAALALVSTALPPVSLLLWFWALGAPVVALGLYTTRHRETRPGVGFGAQLGFMSGLAVLLGISVVNTIVLLVLRYGLHAAGPLDGQLAAVFTQVRAATEAQYGRADAGLFTNFFTVPEFRAGLMLTSLLMFSVSYLLLATLGGAFAGLLRTRDKPG